MPRITCPTCGATLDVTADMIGQTVECGSCQAHFVAQEKQSPSHRAGDDEDRPSRRRREDEDDDRPSRRRPRDEDDFDYEDDYQLRRRRRTSSGGGTGMATASLVLGILSLPLALCCGFLALPASVAGVILGVLGMKSQGRGMAIIGLVLSGVGVLLMIAVMALGLALNLANFGGRGNNFGPRPNNPPPWNQPPPQPPRFK